MPTATDRPLIGVEAQRLYLDLRDRTAAFDLIQDVLPPHLRPTRGDLRRASS